MTMRGKAEQEGENEWVCEKCAELLVEAKVQVHYLGGTFTMEMLRCPTCKMTLVTEEMAVNKMAEAERILEDK